MVLPDSHGISRAPCYLGYHSRVSQISITGLSPCVAVLSRTFIYLIDFLLFEVVSATSEWSHNPITATSENYHADMVWPLPLSLATTNGIIMLFSLPVGTEMFHFPTFPPAALCVQAEVTGHYSSRVSPFGNPRIKALLAAPRGLSQPYTSFIGY